MVYREKTFISFDPGTNAAILRMDLSGSFSVSNLPAEGIELGPDGGWSVRLRNRSLVAINLLSPMGCRSFRFRSGQIVQIEASCHSPGQRPIMFEPRVLSAPETGNASPKRWLLSGLDADRGVEHSFFAKASGDPH
jgi:hypothetical protein